MVRRYSIGTKEHDTWDTDKSGWTYCHYNREPDIHTLARTNGGVEHEKGHYCFRTAEAIKTVLLGLGITIELPPFTLHRRATLKPIPTENKIVVHIDADANDDAAAMAGWINEKKLWKRLFKIGINHAAEIESSSSENFDDVVRHIVTQQGQDAGWLLRKESTWVDEPLVHVRAALAALDRSPKEINSIVGSSVLKAWTLVVKPFQPEYPGNREWNRNAPQLAMSPTQDTERLSFPTWGKMLKHVGSSLDPAVTTHEWCRANGIATGADFLMLWIASLLRRPELPLTYLAFWGDQDSGKSVFHEAIGEILLTCGCVRADQALQNQQGFNSEFVNTILAIVEETDLTRNKTAYNRIKDWTTSPEIMIHPKHGTPYMTRNMLHFVQTANEIEACPIFPGDTRITLIHVPVLTEVIPKPQFKALLRKEAPDFLAAIMMMDLPESESRLAVPTIETASKSRATEKNMSALELFLKEEVYERDGHSVLAEDFYNKMQLWLADKDEKDRGFWTKARIGRELPERFPRGRFGSVQLVSYGNMTFDKDAEPKDQKYMPSETRLFMRLVPTKLPEAKQPETTT